jgi:hypothetical protein
MRRRCFAGCLYSGTKIGPSGDENSARSKERRSGEVGNAKRGALTEYMTGSVRAALQLVLTENVGCRAQRLFRETDPSKYARQLPSQYSHNKNISFTGISTLYLARLEPRRLHGPGKSVRGEIDFGSKWESFKSCPPLLRGIPPWVSIKPPQVSWPSDSLSLIGPVCFRELLLAHVPSEMLGSAPASRRFKTQPMALGRSRLIR